MKLTCVNWYIAYDQFSTCLNKSGIGYDFNRQIFYFEKYDQHGKNRHCAVFGNIVWL